MTKDKKYSPINLPTYDPKLANAKIEIKILKVEVAKLRNNIAEVVKLRNNIVDLVNLADDNISTMKRILINGDRYKQKIKG